MEVDVGDRLDRSRNVVVRRRIPLIDLPRHWHPAVAQRFVEGHYDHGYIRGGGTSPRAIGKAVGGREQAGGRTDIVHEANEGIDVRDVQGAIVPFRVGDEEGSARAAVVDRDVELSAGLAVSAEHAVLAHLRRPLDAKPMRCKVVAKALEQPAFEHSPLVSLVHGAYGSAAPANAPLQPRRHRIPPGIHQPPSAATGC